MSKFSFSTLLPLYQKLSLQDFNFTLPAFNLRGLTFDLASTIFTAAKELKVGALILELARSEREYTRQSFADFEKSVLTAAEEVNFTGPIFLQVDHLQINPGRYQKTLQEEEAEVKKLAQEAVSAGFFNFDFDASSLSFAENIKVTCKLINFMTESFPGVNFNFGAELEEIGGKNTNPEALERFIKELKENFKNPQTLTKIAVQTGTSHGGVVKKTGELQDVKPDFNLLQSLGEKARSLGLAGVVQHGASTLEDQLFPLFPKAKTLEIHLATGIQNLIFDHPDFPQNLREKMKNFVLEKYPSEKLTEEQIFYRERKKAWGEFKNEFSNFPEAVLEPIMLTIKEKIRFWFKSLGVVNTQSLVNNVL